MLSDNPVRAGIDNARSLRIAEVTSRTVQAVQVPRSKLKVAKGHEEVQRVGVYFLFGEPEGETGKPPAYIGEAYKTFGVSLKELKAE